MPYSGDPSTSAADEVRFLIGDTDNNNLRLTDEEVAWLVSKYPTPIVAAYQGALRLFTRFTGMVDKTVGPTSLRYSGLATQYKALMDQLASQGGNPARVGLPLADNVTDPLWSDQSWTKTG